MCCVCGVIVSTTKKFFRLSLVGGCYIGRGFGSTAARGFTLTGQQCAFVGVLRSTVIQYFPASTDCDQAVHVQYGAF